MELTITFKDVVYVASGSHAGKKDESRECLELELY